MEKSEPMRLANLFVIPLIMPPIFGPWFVFFADTDKDVSFGVILYAMLFMIFINMIPFKLVVAPSGKEQIHPGWLWVGTVFALVCLSLLFCVGDFNREVLLPVGWIAGFYATIVFTLLLMLHAGSFPSVNNSYLFRTPLFIALFTFAQILPLSKYFSNSDTYICKRTMGVQNAIMEQVQDAITKKIVIPAISMVPPFRADCANVAPSILQSITTLNLSLSNYDLSNYDEENKLKKDKGDFEKLNSLKELWLSNEGSRELTVKNYNDSVAYLRSLTDKTPWISVTRLNLELSNNSLKKLPAHGFQQLTHLTLSSNEVNNLSSNVFKNLTELTHLTLNLSDTTLQSLPDSVFGNLKKLTHLTLNLPYMQLQGLPGNVFENLTELTHLTLNLSDTELQGLPDSVFGKLNNLTHLTLNLPNMQLENLSDNVFENLKKLTHLTLNLSDTELQGLPDSVFGNLKKLTHLTLNLPNMQLENLSDNVFGNLNNLTHLDLKFSDNELKVRPDNMFDNLIRRLSEGVIEETIQSIWATLNEYTEGSGNEVSPEVPPVDNDALSDDRLEKWLTEMVTANTDSSNRLFVIGIEEYTDEQTAKVEFSKRTAERFAQVAKKRFGIEDSKSEVLLNGEATGLNIQSKLSLMLGRMTQNDTLYFYFSGHGTSIKEAESGDTIPYLVVSDQNPSLIRQNEEYKLSSILKTLEDSSAGKVLVIVDACFSGKTEHGTTIPPGMALTMGVQDWPNLSGKIAVITAGTGSQVSNALDQTAHPNQRYRLFSYYLMEKLMKEEYADIGSLYEDVKQAVEQESGSKGVRSLYEQTPEIQGNSALRF